jgi:hypothetical protein
MNLEPSMCDRLVHLGNMIVLLHIHFRNYHNLNTMGKRSHRYQGSKAFQVNMYSRNFRN